MATTLDTSVDEKAGISSRNKITPSIRPISFGDTDMDRIYGNILGLIDKSTGIMPPRSTYEFND